MRLFIAINFDEETKETLLSLQRRLKACAQGNFSRPENLHMTVLFLGEVTDDSAVRKSIGDHFTSPVELTFSGTGTFGRNLYWVGVRPNPALAALHHSLADDLTQAGFSFDSKGLSPHITLARQVVLHGQPDLSFEPFSMTARRLSLMKSERIGGILTYTEIYGKNV